MTHNLGEELGASVTDDVVLKVQGGQPPVAVHGLCHRLPVVCVCLHVCDTCAMLRGGREEGRGREGRTDGQREGGREGESE